MPRYHMHKCTKQNGDNGDMDIGVAFTLYLEGPIISVPPPGGGSRRRKTGCKLRYSLLTLHVQCGGAGNGASRVGCGDRIKSGIFSPHAADLQRAQTVVLLQTTTTNRQPYTVYNNSKHVTHRICISTVSTFSPTTDS